MDWLFKSGNAGAGKVKPPFFPICLGYALKERANYVDENNQIHIIYDGGEEI
jgi:hypothetical protein